MKKIITSAIITSIILLTGLSFIEIEDTFFSEEENSIIYSLDKIPNSITNINLLSIRERDIITATSRGLVRKNNEGKIEGDLASDFKVSEDGIEYTFKIRNDLYWNNGDIIQSKDIVDFFRELLKEEKDENLDGLLNVYGAKEYRKGNVTFENGVAIKSVDNNIIIRLNSKDDKFLESLTKPNYRIRRFLVMWEDLKNNYKTIPYTGDFYISNVEENYLELKINKYNLKEAYVNTIRLVQDTNSELAMASFDVGERDIVVNPPKSELNRLASEKKLITLPSDKGKYLSLSENINLENRIGIYNTFKSAIELYSSKNPYFIEISEETYFKDDKKDLNKIQARKVMSNKNEGKLDEITTLLAKDTVENRAICKNIQTWIKENTNNTLRYSLVTDEEYENKELRKRYDAIIVEANAVKKYEEEFFNSIDEWLNDKNKEILKNKNFSKLEDNLFNSYTFLPLAFENTNIAISEKVKNINFDFYGNLDFSNMNKNFYEE